MNGDAPLLGCTSMVLWNKRLTEAVQLLARAGFDTIEIWADHLFKTEEKPADVRAALDGAGIRCTVHCPIIDVNICSMNRVVAETSLELYLRSLETAKELRALVFVFHPGKLFSAFDPLPQYWKKLEHALRRVLEANSSELLVVAENMEADKPEEVVKSGQDLVRLLQLAAPLETGVCWDLTHLLSTENNLAFLRTVPRVDHVHVSDCLHHEDGPARKHLRIGEGNLDLSRLLQQPMAEKAAIASLETVIIDPALADLVSERRKLRELLGPGA